jgi:staphylococcal nuclease domain-containing protein 1
VSTHLRPLDMSLSLDRIPAIAREAVLALTTTRPLETDQGVDAARLLQSLAWGKDLTARVLGPDESGKLCMVLSLPGQDESINAQLITEGMARVAKKDVVDALSARMADGGKSVSELLTTLNQAQTAARNARAGMWRYGDVGDDDPDEI